MTHLVQTSYESITLWKRCWFCWSRNTFKNLLKMSVLKHHLEWFRARQKLFWKKKRISSLKWSQLNEKKIQGFFTFHFLTFPNTIAVNRSFEGYPKRNMDCSNRTLYSFETSFSIFLFRLNEIWTHDSPNANHYGLWFLTFFPHH